MYSMYSNRETYWILHHNVRQVIFMVLKEKYYCVLLINMIVLRTECGVHRIILFKIIHTKYVDVLKKKKIQYWLA